MDSVLAFIRQIGEWLVPTLLSGGTVGFLVKEVWKYFKNKKHIKKLDITIGLLEKLTQQSTYQDDVKNNTDELKGLVTELKDLKNLIKNDDQVAHDQTAALGQMIGVIFENSTLPFETKERLRALKTKIEYSSDAKVVDVLLSENSKLKKQVTDLDNKLQQTKVEEQVQVVYDTADSVSAPQENTKPSLLIQ